MARASQIAVLTTGFLFMACRDSARSGSPRSDSSPALRQDAEGSGRNEQWSLEKKQLSEPIEALSEADLFREYEDALTENRKLLIRDELVRTGSLTTADRLEAIAAKFQSPHERIPLLYSAASIRSRILQTREARVSEMRIRLTRIGPNSFWGGAHRSVEIVAKEGLLELRDEVHAVATFGDSPMLQQSARQSLVVLDLWAVGKTPEETFTLAVENGDLALKEWALLQLKDRPAISSASRKRVVAAMSDLLAAAEERRKRFIPTPASDVALGLPTHGIVTANTPDDYRVHCAMRVFWEKHDPAVLQEFEPDSIWRHPMSCRQHN